MSKNITKRQKTALKINVIWTAIIIGMVLANLAYTVYIFPSTVYVQESLPIAEDPLEAWSEASYVVWEYNSTHFACRNMSTNMVEYLGTSDDNAIQWGIDNSTAKNGGTVYVKASMFNGTYNAAVTLKDKVRLVLSNGAAGITVTIDSGATATLEDFHNYDFKRWDSGVLVSFIEDRSQIEPYSYILSKLGSYYYAKNGTTGSIDYSNTNASYVINSALGDLPSTGGSLFFKSKVFELNATININTKNVTLTGEGKGSVLKAMDNVNLPTIINITEQDDATNHSRVYTRIENIKLDGNKANNGSEVGIFTHKSMWVDISRVHFNNLEKGIHLYGDGDATGSGTWHVLIEECMFGGYEGNNTINIKGDYAHQVVVDGNVLEDSTQSAINLTRCKEWVISNNEIDDSVQYGIILNNTGDAYKYMTVIDGNTFSDTVDYHCIYVGPTVWHVTISNNILFDTYRQALDGILVRGRYVTIDANVIRNMYGYGIRTCDVLGVSPMFITITDNIIHDCLDYGIRNEANYTSITGNVIINCSRPIRNYADYVVIQNNVFKNYTDPPLFDGTVEEIVHNNIGFITEPSGTAEASNTDYIAFGVTFAGTPTVLLTVEESDDAYIAQPYSVNATHFRLFLADDTGAAENVDKTINWYAEYRP